MIVYIRHNDKQIAVDVAPNATVSDLIDAAKAVGLSASTPLSYGGRLLDEPNARLSDLGIGAQAQLTAMMTSISSFVDDADFEIKGKVATLKLRPRFGLICFTHRTMIGQKSKLRLRITSDDVRISTKDIMSGNWDDAVRYLKRQSSEHEISIIVNAKQQNDVKVRYQHPKTGRIDNWQYNKIDGYTADPKTEFQTCVTVSSNEMRAKIEIIDFKIV